MEANLHVAFAVLAAMLVLLTQAGATALAAGLCRPKNSINTAITKLTDTITAATLYWVLGFGLMYGTSAGGLVGTSKFFVPDDIGASGVGLFLLQLLACTMAVTILSGAVAERMTFKGYLLVSALFAGFLYPVFGHWAVGNGWLQRAGFVDRAGATYIHSLGGWLALAGLLAVGNRTGRYARSGKAIRVIGSSVSLSAIGASLLWLGFIGWLGGATGDLRQAPKAIVDGLLAGAGGGLAALAMGRVLFKTLDVELLFKGLIAGLVAVSAGAAEFPMPAALAVGVGGGVVMTLVSLLLDRLHVDDAVGAVPAHLGAGLFGTLAVVPFVKGASFAVQLQGIVACAAWGFGASFLFFKLAGIFIKVRVSRDEEFAGLNVSEHQASTELMEVMDALEETARMDAAGLAGPVEPFTEVAQLAFDAEGIVTYANTAASSIFGFGEREFKKVNITQLFAPPREGDFDLAAIRAAFSVESKEVVGLRRTGEEFPAEVSLGFAGIVGSDEQIEAVTFKDISARREREGGLSRTQAEVRSWLDREVQASGRVVRHTVAGRDLQFPGGEVALQLAVGDAGDWFGFLYDEKNQTITVYAGDAVSQASATTVALLAQVGGGDEEESVTHGLMLGDLRYPPERQLRNLADVVNRIVLATYKGELHVAMTFVHLDLRTGDATSLSAGRPLPLMIKSGRAVRDITSGGTPLGSTTEPEFDIKKLPIAAGDLIVMYSAGLIGTFGPDGKVMQEKELKKVILSRDNVKDTRDEILTRAKAVWKDRTAEMHSVAVLKWTPGSV